VLDGAARTAIQFVHRIGALVVFGHLCGLIARALRRNETRAFALAVGAALLLQIGLGIANVEFALPLAVATAHNGVAVLLLFALLSLLVRLRRS
jgi:cytochrome c oxidase assembly protein subunit 15